MRYPIMVSLQYFTIGSLSLSSAGSFKANRPSTAIARKHSGSSGCVSAGPIRTHRPHSAGKSRRYNATPRIMYAMESACQEVKRLDVCHGECEGTCLPGAMMSPFTGEYSAFCVVRPAFLRATFWKKHFIPVASWIISVF